MAKIGSLAVGAVSSIAVASRAGTQGLRALEYPIGGLRAGRVATVALGAYFLAELLGRHYGITDDQYRARQYEQQGSHP
jgi:hypothetical protein